MHQTLADVLETINQAEARNDSKLSLTFPQNRLSVEDFQTIGNALAASPTITTLSIHEYYLGSLAEHVRAIAFIEILAASPTITTLDLTCNWLGNLAPEHALAFAEALAASKSITTLDLKGNSLSNLAPEHAVAVAKALAASKTIQKLDLSTNNLGNLAPEHAIAFIEILAASPTITTLNLDGNNLGKLGERAVAFIEKIAASKNITTLHLRDNNLGNLAPKHAIAFIEALAASKTITTLNLSCNNLGNLGERLKPLYDTLTETAQKTKLKLITGLQLPRFAELPLVQSLLKLRQALQKAVPFHIVFDKQLNPKKYSSKEQAAEEKESKHPILALPQALLHHIRSFLDGEEDPLRSKKQDPFGSETLSNQLITRIAPPKAPAEAEQKEVKHPTFTLPLALLHDIRSFLSGEETSFQLRPKRASSLPQPVKTNKTILATHGRRAFHGFMKETASGKKTKSEDTFINHKQKKPSKDTCLKLFRFALGDSDSH